MPRKKNDVEISLIFPFFDETFTLSGIENKVHRLFFVPLQLDLSLSLFNLCQTKYQLGYLTGLLFLCARRRSSSITFRLFELSNIMKSRADGVWSDLQELERLGIISSLRRGESIPIEKEKKRKEYKVQLEEVLPSEQAPPRIPDGIPMTSEEGCVINPEQPAEKKTTCQTPDAIVELWNRDAHPSLPRIKQLNSKRQKRLKILLKQNPDPEFWESQIKSLNASPFLLGHNSNSWLADFDWFLTEKAQTKLVEGTFSSSGKSTLRGLWGVYPAAMPQQVVVEGFSDTKSITDKKQTDKDRLDELKRKMNNKPNEPEEQDHEF